MSNLMLQRIFFGFAGLLLILMGFSACGSGIQTRSPELRGILRFQGQPGEAHIEIDDISLGPLYMFEKDGVALKPGPHRIIAKADGFFTEYKIVEVKVDVITIVKITLRPMP